jgi:uncharacterized glyoxalase superfamily protein PhnB
MQMNSRPFSENLACPGPAVPWRSMLRTAEFLRKDTYQVMAVPAWPSNIKTGVTPALECDSAAEVDRPFAALAAGGRVLLPRDACRFSKRFGRVTDTYGVAMLSLTNDAPPPAAVLTVAAGRVIAASSRLLPYY